MLLVRTVVQTSPIHGIGLFAHERIPKGTTLWRFNPKFDIYFSPDEVIRMTDHERELVFHFAFLSKQTGQYVYSIDNTRFANHSSYPNMGIDTRYITESNEVSTVALRDIESGEEMTIDYTTLDAHDAHNPEAYLTKQIV